MSPVGFIKTKPEAGRYGIFTGDARPACSPRQFPQNANEIAFKAVFSRHTKRPRGSAMVC